jgi:hypothetical protein
MPMDKNTEAQFVQTLSEISHELKKLRHATLLAAKAISTGASDMQQTLIRKEIDKLLKE